MLSQGQLDAKITVSYENYLKSLKNGIQGPFETSVKTAIFGIVRVSQCDNTSADIVDFGSFLSVIVRVLSEMVHLLSDINPKN